MDTIVYLKHQLANLNAVYHSIVEDLRPEELAMRPAEGSNRVGYTVWHIPRTQDAHVQTWIRGVPEVARDERWGPVRELVRYGYGVGIRLAEADEIAQTVRLPEILDYADAVHKQILDWLTGLEESDLDRVPDYPAHLASHPEYQSPGYLEEVEDLFDQPIAGQLMRPCIGHVHRHMGELQMAKAVLRSRAAS